MTCIASMHFTVAIHSLYFNPTVERQLGRSRPSIELDI